MPKKVQSKPESAVQVIADLHTGKETKSFNVEVLTERVSQYFDRAIRCIEIEQAGRDITELVSLVVGDAVDGSLIFKTHPFHTDKAAPFGRAQVNALVDILAPNYERTAELVDTVRIEITPGNHGRTDRFDHEMNNFDLMVGDALARYFHNHPKISVKVHNDFYGWTDVQGHGILTYHGASIRAYQTIPWYGIVQRCMRWSGSMPNPFRYLMMGHWHTTGQMDWNDKSIYLTGTAMTDDDFALEVLGMSSSTRWWLLGMHPEHGISWQYKLDLVKPVYETAKSKG